MANIAGDDLDNTLSGAGGDDIVFGFGGDDTISAIDGASETILGGEGDDIVIYAGDWADYTITRIFGGSYTVSDGVSTDVITGAEMLDFNGDVYDLAGDPDGVTSFPAISTPERAFRSIEQGTTSAALGLVAPAGTPNGPFTFKVLTLPAGSTVYNGPATLTVGDVLSAAAFEALTYAPPTSVPGAFQLQFLVSDGVDSEVLAVAVNVTPGANSALTGTEAANLLDGAFGDDSLTGLGGADTLIGGVGRDTLAGGQGNDVYLNPTGDVIVELAGQGSDTVSSNTHFGLTGYAQVENVRLTGSGDINAVGNGLANVLTGNAGANRFRGGAGADTLIGGAGNDTYIDPTGDAIREFLGQGTDTVESSTNFSLSGVQHVENLILTGHAGINATGNSFGNTLTGNDGDNRFRGGAGSDTIDGGQGADVFVFGQVSDSTGPGRDVIVAMDLGEDRFDFASLPLSIAAGVSTGALSAVSFNADLAAAIGAGQLGAGQAVMFDPDAGDLGGGGRSFLIADANGVAGYQAGADFVVQLDHATGTLTLDDFT